jgi:TolA-binding protein
MIFISRRIFRRRRPVPRLVKGNDNEIAQDLSAATEWHVDQQRLDENLTRLEEKIADQELPRMFSLKSGFIRRRRIKIILVISMALTFGAASAYFIAQEFRPEENIKKPTSKKPLKVIEPALKEETQKPEKKPEPTPEKKKITIISKRSNNPSKNKIKKIVAQSTLAQEIATYEKAKSLMKNHDYQHALISLRSLEQNHPESPLLYESLQSQTECLYKLGRFEQVVNLIKQIIDQRALAEKKAELYLLLGDSYLQLNMCQLARPAYLNALSLGLSEVQSTSAKDGLAECNLSE